MIVDRPRICRPQSREELASLLARELCSNTRALLDTALDRALSEYGVRRENCDMQYDGEWRTLAVFGEPVVSYTVPRFTDDGDSKIDCGFSVRLRGQQEGEKSPC